MQLQGKVAVVTGAASGIGHALAKRFAAEGATVVLADIRGDSDQLRAEPVAGRFVQADLSREAGVKALLDDVVAREGRIDLFASNAGIAFPMDISASDRDWERIVSINQMSHVWVARHLVPHMLERGDGYLLITASAAGLLNEIGSFGYGVTKHAAVGLAEWLSFTYRDQGLRVSVLCPEGVATPMISDSGYLSRDAVTPEHVADVVVQAMHAERFMITTHEGTLKKFLAKASDYELYMSRMAELRRRVVAAYLAAKQQ